MQAKTIVLTSERLEKASKLAGLLSSTRKKDADPRNRASKRLCGGCPRQTGRGTAEESMLRQFDSLPAAGKLEIKRILGADVLIYSVYDVKTGAATIKTVK